jgi:hypothetical protein
MHLERLSWLEESDCDKLLVVEDVKIGLKDDVYTQLKTKVQHLGDGSIVFAFDNQESLAVVAVNSVHLLYC